jgi:hypothetical protein
VRGYLKESLAAAVLWVDMVTNSAVVRVGRLLEVAVRAGYRNVADVDALFDEIDRAIASLPANRRHVTCADWRYCTVMTPDTSHRLKERLVRLNGRTERSVAVTRADSPTAVMQFLRLIREANFPDRKVFFTPEAAIEWLSEVLVPEEVARLREFLNVRPDGRLTAPRDARGGLLRGTPAGPKR